MTNDFTSEETLIFNRQKEIDEDYELTRRTLRALLEANERMIPKLENICEKSEHPRSFEVLSKLNKDTADISAQLLDMQRKKQVVDTESAMEMIAAKERQGELPTLTAHVIEDKTEFTGTAADMQKNLRKRKEKQVVDK